MTHVRASGLAAALGISVKTLVRWIARGKVPPPPAREADEWRRWPVETAAAILAARGRPVPAEWTAPAVERAA